MKTITLTNGLVAFVDDCDYERLSPYTWSYVKSKSTYYARRREGGSMFLMHREVVGATAGMDVDHRDGKGLHNWRGNLRECTHSQNMRNQQNRIVETSSRFRGVSLDNRAVRRGFTKVWRAYLTINYKYICLGRHATEEEAARAYDAAARENYGEYAQFNFAEYGRRITHAHNP